MDVRGWIVVIVMWFLALIVVLLSLLPAAPWARSRGWRTMRLTSAATLVLMALVNTLNVLALEHRSVFSLSPDVSSIVTLVLIGLALLGAASMIFLGMLLSWARTPEVARMLHVPPRLYAWLYNRDINESSQAVSSTQLLPGDH